MASAAGMFQIGSSVFMKSFMQLFTTSCTEKAGTAFIKWSYNWNGGQVSSIRSFLKLDYHKLWLVEKKHVSSIFKQFERKG